MPGGPKTQNPKRPFSLSSNKPLGQMHLVKPVKEVRRLSGRGLCLSMLLIHSTHQYLFCVGPGNTAVNVALVTPVHMEIMCHQEASAIGKVDCPVASHTLTCLGASANPLPSFRFENLDLLSSTRFGCHGHQTGLDLALRLSQV